MPINSNKLIDAASLLFGKEVSINLDFIKHLKPSGLKSAYREKVIQNHPDKAQSLGLEQEVLAERFRNITIAYEILVPFVKGEKQVSANSSSSNSTTNHNKAYSQTNSNNSSYSSTKNNHSQRKDHYYKGLMPKRKLRFASYLYYKGIISWNTLINAVVWQKRKRPMIGQLALEAGYLNAENISEIIYNIGNGVTFGARAKEMNLLNLYQINLLLKKQDSYDCKVGKYFTENNFFSTIKLNLYIQDFNKYLLSL